MDDPGVINGDIILRDTCKKDYNAVKSPTITWGIATAITIAKRNNK